MERLSIDEVIGQLKYMYKTCMNEKCKHKGQCDLCCETKDIAIQALEEIQQYRAIGTVEETQKKMEELERWHTDRINENIKNPFAYTSTLICHNCDHKDEYIEELESEVAEYKTIGTVEEFKALKEKNEPKKPRFYAHNYYCTECGNLVGNNEFEWQRFLYCDKCGQKLDWE